MKPATRLPAAGWLFAAMAVAEVFPLQPAKLAPRNAEGGVLFECFAPDAQRVYLAGDFNGWAQNVDGRITKPEFAMTGPDTNGVWRKTVKFDAGIYRFKFNLNGSATSWYAPDFITERDADSNAIFRVTAAGDVVVRSNRNPQWKPRRTDRGILFQLHAPDAFIVYLAGSFNDWAKKRDGLVSDPQFAMTGPDSNGVWRAEVELKPGRYVYQFVIDGDRWLADPNADETDTANRSVLVVP